VVLQTASTSLRHAVDRVGADSRAGAVAASVLLLVLLTVMGGCGRIASMFPCQRGAQSADAAFSGFLTAAANRDERNVLRNLTAGYTFSPRLLDELAAVLGRS